MEREVKDLRRSRMYQCCNFLTRLGKQSLQVFGYIWLFDEMRAEFVRDHFDFFDLFFNFFEEERIIILAFLGFEPTHLCDPSDQRRL